MDTVSRIPPTHWRYVQTDCNPADVASRESLPCNPISFELWRKGPAWLLQPPSAWPSHRDRRNQKDLVETKPAVLLTTPPLEDFTEVFSSYKHLKRVTSWCMRFVCNCRSILSGRIHSFQLSLDELKSIEIRLLKLSQKCSFNFSPLEKFCSGAVSLTSDPT